MTVIDLVISTMKPLIIDAIGEAEEYLTEIELMQTLECSYTKRAYALGRAIEQLIFENKIYIDPNDEELHIMDPPKWGLVVTPLFSCPFCDDTETYPLSSLQTHVAKKHYDEYEDFKDYHLPEMEKRQAAES